MADGTLPDLTIFTLDDEAVAAQPGETIWEVAKRHGKTIPHLCHKDQKGYRSDGNCRACVVEIDGERTLAASCCRNPSKGMVVKTDSDRATKARALVMELLLADQPRAGRRPRCRVASVGHGRCAGCQRQPLPDDGSRAHPAAGRLPRRHARQSGCLHPVRANAHSLNPPSIGWRTLFSRRPFAPAGLIR